MKELPRARSSVIFPTRRLAEWPRVCLYAGLSAHLYRERTIIDLPAGISPVFPDISAAYPPPSPPCHPWRVRHTPALGFTTPVCLRHTIFLPPAPTLAHVWGRSGGTRARNSLKLGNRGAALWPHNDKMVYNILVHYKPFYSGQYRDKVLTKVV